MTVNRERIAFRENRNVLKLIVVKVVNIHIIF
jgi:hypothetical protein